MFPQVPYRLAGSIASLWAAVVQAFCCVQARWSEAEAAPVAVQAGPTAGQALAQQRAAAVTPPQADTTGLPGRRSFAGPAAAGALQAAESEQAAESRQAAAVTAQAGSEAEASSQGGGALLQGDFSEASSHAAFLAAVREWRGGKGAAQSAAGERAALQPAAGPGQAAQQTGKESVATGECLHGDVMPDSLHSAVTVSSSGGACKDGRPG